MRAVSTPSTPRHFTSVFVQRSGSQDTSPESRRQNEASTTYIVALTAPAPAPLLVAADDPCIGPMQVSSLPPDMMRLPFAPCYSILRVAHAHSHSADLVLRQFLRRDVAARPSSSHGLWPACTVITYTVLYMLTRRPGPTGWGAILGECGERSGRPKARMQRLSAVPS